ncbi:MAG: hypothetical protein ACK5NQ_12545 [Pseudomonas sp.]
MNVIKESETLQALIENLRLTGEDREHGYEGRPPTPRSACRKPDSTVSPHWDTLRFAMSITHMTSVIDRLPGRDPKELQGAPACWKYVT